MRNNQRKLGRIAHPFQAVAAAKLPGIGPEGITARIKTGACCQQEQGGRAKSFETTDGFAIASGPVSFV